MKSETVDIAVRLLISQISELSQVTHGDNDFEKLEALKKALSLTRQMISQISPDTDASILTKGVGELMNIQFGTKSEFIKSYNVSENRHENKRMQVTRAILAVAQELLASSSNEMNLKLAREYIEKRSRFSASQLEDQRKKIMSGNVNADEIEVYNQLKAKTKDSKNRKADADIILQGIDHI
ncbi:hypothetical protein OAI24_03825 [Alphaproteobacteria bacterium]|nr:hypothetical protein [Alphaproteobacteria bacterium]